MSILLGKGQRGVLIGRTGSGKTWGGIFQLQHSPQPVVIVLDTKGEPAFNTLPRENETHEFYNSGDAFLKAYRSSDLPNYMIVRPSPDEIADPLEMDGILAGIYTRNRECLTYIDEAYQWHVNGRAGAGLVGLLTRGRSKGMSTLISTQRPAWVSRFVFSEAEKYYIYRLLDKRDKKTISEYIPISIDDELPKYHFWYYDNLDDDQRECLLYRPVPKPIKIAAVSESGVRWI
jgi:hypothetical protein